MRKSVLLVTSTVVVFVCLQTFVHCSHTKPRFRTETRPDNRTKYMTSDGPKRSPRGKENRKPQRVHPDISVTKAFYNQYEHPLRDQVGQYFGTIMRKNKVKRQIKVLKSKGNGTAFIRYSFSELELNIQCFKYPIFAIIRCNINIFLFIFVCCQFEFYHYAFHNNTMI